MEQTWQNMKEREDNNQKQDEHRLRRKEKEIR